MQQRDSQATRDLWLLIRWILVGHSMGNMSISLYVGERFRMKALPSCKQVNITNQMAWSARKGCLKIWQFWADKWPASAMSQSYQKLLGLRNLSARNSDVLNIWWFKNERSDSSALNILTSLQPQISPGWECPNLTRKRKSQVSWKQHSQLHENQK